MIPCVSLTETSVLYNMKERIKDMRVFGCRLNFWHHSISSSNALAHSKGLSSFFLFFSLILSFYRDSKERLVTVHLLFSFVKKNI